MNKTVIGIVLAVLAMYVWGFFYWTLNPLADSAVLRNADDVAVQQALSEHFTTSGTYFIPGDMSDQEVFSERHQAGPIAMVWVRLEGTDPMAPMVFIKGALQYLIGAILLAMLLGMVCRTASRFQFVLVFALAASYYTQLGATVWFHQTAAFPIFMFVYEFVTWLLAGLILMKFVPVRRHS